MTKPASKTQAKPANYDKLKGRVISENFDAFQKELPKLLKKYRDWYAVLRDKKVAGIFRTMDEAGPFGREQFSDGMYSIQLVTDSPIDFGGSMMPCLQGIIVKKRHKMAKSGGN